MKKLCLILFLLLFSAALSAETLYYYVEGKKVILTEDFSSYSFIRTSITRANFVLPQSVKLLKKNENASIIEISDASAKETLLKNGLLFPAYIKDGIKLHVSGMIFVKIPGRPNAENAEKWCKKNGVTFIKQYQYIPQWYLVSVEGNPIKKAAELVESKAAEAAEPSFFIPIKKRAYIPNDTLFSNQWHLHNDGSNSSVSGNDHARVAEAWEVLQTFKGNLGGRGVKLAIVDDGFDLDHEDLAGRFTNGKDFGDNDSDPTYKTYSQSYCNKLGYNNEDCSDMHGTACAGVAAAAVDNGKGVAGACPECTVIPIRIDFLSDTALDDYAIESFQWAASAGADIISNSWGPLDNEGAVDASTPLKNLFAQLATEGRNGKGIIILFAAGNGNESIDASSTKDGFASNENVFAIGATKADGKRCSYSDYGPSLDFMVPSSDFNSSYTKQYDGIWTVDNTGSDGYNKGSSSQGDRYGNYTNDFSGTSSACPLAAGITGLVLAANPDLTRNQVYQIYKNTADKVGGVSYSNGFNEKYGYGRINACKAVKKALKLAGEDVSQVVCSGDPETDDSDDDYTDTGDTGDSGDTGDTGHPGDTGDTGDTGHPGDTGDSSDTTDTGDIPAGPDCGNGRIDSNEICDGNTIPCANLAGTPKNGTAVCASNCMGWDKSGCYDSSDDSSSADSGDSGSCGNGIVEEGEECDDGNRTSGDGCSKYCMTEDSKSSGSGCALDLL